MPVSARKLKKSLSPSGKMRRACLALLLLCLGQHLVATQAAPWDGQLFNYQLQAAFSYPADGLQGVSVYFIDLFDNDASTVLAMRNAGLVPVCYFSTQYENWRPDAASFPAAALGKPLDGWPGENWVDFNNPTIRDIMRARIALCKQKGFLAVDPDNTDGYQASQGTGFNTTKADTLNFLTFLSTEARAQGMGIGLKNTLELIAGNTGLWDFAVNEQCFDYKECNFYTPFQQANKTVYNIQYTDSSTTFQSTICPYTMQYGLISIRKPKNQSLNKLPCEACAARQNTTSPPPSPPSSTPPPSTPPPPPATYISPIALPGCVQGLAIPSYFYPGALWSQAKGAASITVINPASGPGTAVNTDYVATVNSMRAAGTVVLGYVYTQYGKRDPALVQADIASYLTWYNVSGVFLDEGSNICADVPYYDALVAYTRASKPGAIMVLNWGTDGPECYLTTANPVDIVLNYENIYAEYLKWTGPSAWTNNYNASRFWQLVHTTPSTPEAFWRAITLSKSRRAGFVYVTDDAGANPWDTLPQGGLWALQVSMLRSPQQVAIQGPYAAPCTTSTCAWQLAKGNARITVANPSSGPGTSSNANWARLVTDMRNSGSLILGYVGAPTTKNLTTAKAEVSKYFTWYPGISGIFFDQASSICTAANLDYYGQLVAYVRSFNPSAVVAMNWGAAGSECYLTAANAADIFNVYEGTATGYKTYTPAAWAAKYPPYRFMSTIYSATTANFNSTVTSTAVKRSGYAYVTTGGSSLAALPSATQWTQELSLLANANMC